MILVPFFLFSQPSAFIHHESKTGVQGIVPPAVSGPKLFTDHDPQTRTCEALYMDRGTRFFKGTLISFTNEFGVTVKGIMTYRQNLSIHNRLRILIEN